MNYYNYFTEIEETFVRRRGKHLLLSPIDWAMIEGWQDRRIPLHIVIRAIESVFDGFEKNPRPRAIKGLLYCKEEVEAQFLEWATMQAGKASQEPAASGEDAPDVVGHIENVIETLSRHENPDLREDIERGIARMKELAENYSDDLQMADRALSDIESLLEHALLTKTDQTRLAGYQKEIAAQLRPYKSEMTPESYEQTTRVMLLKRLRDEEGIPRLSLFYL